LVAIQSQMNLVHIRSPIFSHSFILLPLHQQIGLSQVFPPKPHMHVFQNCATSHAQLVLLPLIIIITVSEEHKLWCSSSQCRFSTLFIPISEVFPLSSALFLKTPQSTGFVQREIPRLTPIQTPGNNKQTQVSFSFNVYGFRLRMGK